MFDHTEFDGAEKAAMQRVIELHREAVRQVEKQGFVDLDLVDRIRTAQDIGLRPLLARLWASFGPLDPEDWARIVAELDRSNREQFPALSAAHQQLIRQVMEKDPDSIH